MSTENAPKQPIEEKINQKKGGLSLADLAMAVRVEAKNQAIATQEKTADGTATKEESK